MEINPIRDIYVGELNMTDPAQEPYRLTTYHLDKPKNIVFDMVPWNPADLKCSPLIMYRDLQGEGIRGWYDTMPDGTPAYEIDGNRARVNLVPQMTQKVGHVAVYVSFMGSDLNRTTQPLCTLQVVESAHICDAQPETFITVRPMTPEELEDPETKAWWEGLKAQDTWTGPDITVELVSVSGPGMKLEG